MAFCVWLLSFSMRFSDDRCFGRTRGSALTVCIPVGSSGNRLVLSIPPSSGSPPPPPACPHPSRQLPFWLSGPSSSRHVALSWQLPRVPALASPHVCRHHQSLLLSCRPLALQRATLHVSLPEAHSQKSLTAGENGLQGQATWVGFSFTGLMHLGKKLNLTKP